MRDDLIPLMLTIHPDCAPFLSEGKTVLLGLSGGRDSVALLHVLCGLGCRVLARHLHHGIRDAEADADASFCRQLCVDLGVDFAESYADVPHLAMEASESLELCARRVRRAYLLDEARAAGCSCIALAQHADDQAETVLFRLARGSAGPRAMQPVCDYEDLSLLRPLLPCRRADITAYLQSIHQQWRDDASNDSCEHTRNALRHVVLPAYAQAMGRDVVPILARSAALQGATASALQDAITLLRPHFYDPQGRIYLPALLACSPELSRAVLHDYLHRAGIPNISSQLLYDIQAIAGSSTTPSCLNLPSGRQLRRAHQRVFIV